MREAVALLGEVIRAELGSTAFARIESLRRDMAGLRDTPTARAYQTLERAYDELSKLDAGGRMGVAHSFGLMLELMNACENAYRSHRLAARNPTRLKSCSSAVIYVLTAHPTESRSPENISVFQAIQRALQAALRHGFEHERETLLHLIEVAWRVAVARNHKPSVADEAEHLYSIVLRKDMLDAILAVSREIAPLYLRTWVGGDKDGHPGVDERAMMQSLQLARTKLADFFEARIGEVKATAHLMHEGALATRCERLRRELRRLRRLSPGDGARVRKLRTETRKFSKDYERAMGAPHPALQKLLSLLHLFPGLVVPLELRESSDIIVRAAQGKRAAIARMLERLGLLARGGEPTWYARGFIISMASSIDHVRAACSLSRRALGALKLPVIPLFEQREALEESAKIVAEMLRYRPLRDAVDRYWSGYFEVMLGYSDSAKESGVLPSRLAISRAVHRLDQILRRARVTPLFFHGSGGSVDRGGGSIQEQTAWWPASALDMYKATIQGEMIERSFASPEIARGQLETIARRCLEGASHGSARNKPGVLAFSDRVREAYQRQIASPEFLDVVQRATPYRYLSALKIGSRPSKRGSALGAVTALRAIPWVLCWTQTRVLFPTWWGVGMAWREADARSRRELRRAFKSDPLFRSYVKLLGFTLEKVELPVWRVYLEHSSLERTVVSETFKSFEREYRDAIRFVREISGCRDLLWFRPWLGTSIRLRAPMIHPLNLLQIITLHERNAALLRETVTGIASGMMTTG